MARRSLLPTVKKISIACYLTATAVSQSTSLHRSPSYRVAYVEHATIVNRKFNGTSTKTANAEVYIEYIKNASAKGAEMIVFPENGLTGYPFHDPSDPQTSISKWIDHGYTETIPAPPASGARVVPCDATDTFIYAPTVILLSCAAKAYGVAVVANLIDRPLGSSALYNTNIALDTDGAFLARYYKVNLWGEPEMTPGTDCPMSSFTTSFGVTFGLLICADLIYEFPALALRESGIRDFVLPLSWSHDWGHMQVLPYAQAWSMQANATLIVANLRRSYWKSGSGVFQGGKALSQLYDTHGLGQMEIVDVPSAEKVSPPRRPQRNDDDSNTWISPGEWAFKALDDSTEVEVCSGSGMARTCCAATVTDGSGSGYVLAALGGQDKGPRPFSDASTDCGAAQICGVLPCSTLGMECLVYQKGAASLSGMHLQVRSGTENGTMMYPVVLGTGKGRDMFVLEPHGGALVQDYFDFDDGMDEPRERAPNLRVNMNSGVILSALLYGRAFFADSLAYVCPVAPTHFGYPAPVIETGTWELQTTPSSGWLSDSYVQTASGSYTGRGFWGGNYTYYGTITQASCSKQSNGNIKVMMQWWYRDSWYGSDEAKIYCAYKEYSGTSPHRVLSRVHFVDETMYSEQQLRAGYLPGACPSTAISAHEGISWMKEMQFSDVGHDVFACTADCGLFACGGTKAPGKRRKGKRGKMGKKTTGKRRKSRRGKKAKKRSGKRKRSTGEGFV